jgi:hypothetical protein
MFIAIVTAGLSLCRLLEWSLELFGGAFFRESPVCVSDIARAFPLYFLNVQRPLIRPVALRDVDAQELNKKKIAIAKRASSGPQSEDSANKARAPGYVCVPSSFGQC